MASLSASCNSFSTRASNSRGLNSDGETEVVLGGIGPGRHRVVVMPVMGGRTGKRVQLEVHFDGDPATVEEIGLDLR